MEKRWVLKRKSGAIPGLIRVQPWDFAIDAMNQEVFTDAHKLTMSVLFMVGEKDTWILPEHVYNLFEKIPSNKKEFHVIKNAPHTMGNFTSEIKQIISAWAKKNNL